MSNKHRLHLASAFIEAIKGIKSFILPAFIVIAVNGFNFNLTSYESILEVLPVAIIIILFFGAIINGVLKWYTYRYWIEENQVRVEYGLFMKKKRFVPIERIQSLNYEEGIIHRLFHVKQVSVETAGGGTSAEVVLTAITKYAADDFEREINRKANAQTFEEQLINGDTTNVIYKMTNKDLMLLATTSNGTGVVLAGIAALFSQLAEFIPFEKISEQLVGILKSAYITAAIVIALLIIVSWGISLLMTYLANYQFTLLKNERQLEITRGLLEKKKSTIVIDKIQAVKVIESPLRQLFGFAQVSIEHASVNATDSNNKLLLLPFIKKNEIEPILQSIDEQFTVQLEGLTTSPKEARGLFYRKYVWIGIPLIAGLSYFVSLYFLITLLVLCVLIIYAVAQHKAAGYEINGSTLKLQYRKWDKVLCIVVRNKIQAVELKQNPIQKTKNVRSVHIHIMGGLAGVNVKVPHQSEETVEALMEFIKR